MNVLHLRQWCFPGKFLNSSEAVTGGVLWKKTVLTNVAIFTGRLQTCNLLKRDSNTSVFLCILLNFYEHLFWETSANGCSWFFETATEHWWIPASALTLLLSSVNLLTVYEQSSY